MRRSWAVMWVDTGGIQAWEAGYGALDHSGRFLRAGTGTVHLTWGGEQAGPVCVTGEAHRSRPPALKGWTRSGELSFRSRTGVVEFFGDGGELLGDVTVGGPGRYRLRAYVRSGAQPEVLIMAWPLKR
ncbi:hypothetical protein [Nonomuraea sp. NPDC050310]|uniref:hypothetical protein n=1 Tax=Nonomuraea sp. NPDC050310 TaxID=3154935 RepID=UPI0033D75D88